MPDESDWLVSLGQCIHTNIYKQNTLQNTPKLSIKFQHAFSIKFILLTNLKMTTTEYIMLARLFCFFTGEKRKHFLLLFFKLLNSENQLLRK